MGSPVMVSVLNEIHHISACALITPVNQKSSCLSGNGLLMRKNSQDKPGPSLPYMPLVRLFWAGNGHFMRPQTFHVSKQIGWCYFTQKVIVFLFGFNFERRRFGHTNNISGD